MKDVSKYSCGKANYFSREEAKTAMERVNRKFKDNGLKSVYFCDVCLAWHTSSMSKQQSRNITRKLKHKPS